MPYINCQGQRIPVAFPKKRPNDECFKQAPRSLPSPPQTPTPATERHMAIALKWEEHAKQDPSFNPNGLGPMKNLSTKESIRNIQLRCYANLIAAWEHRHGKPFTLSINHTGNERL